MTLKRAIRWPVWRIEAEVQAIRGVLFWIGAVAKLWFVWHVDIRGMKPDDIDDILRGYDPSAWEKFENRIHSFHAKWPEFYKEVK